MEQLKYRQALIEKMGVAVTQHHAKTGSIETAWLSAGASSTTHPTIVLLHGAGAGAVTWYPVLYALIKDFHIIIPDIVGYGESDKPDATYDRPFFVAWLKTFLDHLNIEKMHLIGNSQGGAIALQFAINYPDRVDKLVLVNPAGFGTQPALAAFVGMIWMNTFPSMLANRFASHFLLHDVKNKDVNHALYSVAVAKNANGKKAFQQGKGRAVHAFSQQELMCVSQQTCVIWGEDDKLFKLEDAKPVIQFIPQLNFEQIHQAGHLPFMDQPEIFNRIVLDFLIREV